MRIEPGYMKKKGYIGLNIFWHRISRMLALWSSVMKLMSGIPGIKFLRAGYRVMRLIYLGVFRDTGVGNRYVCPAISFLGVQLHLQQEGGLTDGVNRRADLWFLSRIVLAG